MLSPWMQAAFDRRSATPEQMFLNTAMSSVRVAVEWNYKELKQMWSANDYARNLRPSTSVVGLELDFLSSFVNS